MFTQNNPIIKQASATLIEALKTGDSTKVEQAYIDFGTTIAESVRESMVVANGDSAILAQRGHRQLTTQEKKYYEIQAKAGLSDNPKQYLASLPDSEGKIMPTTIIEDVFKDLKTNNRLLDKINFQTVEYLTRWIMNDNSVETAKWGNINGEIVKNVQAAFKVIEIAQCKLSAFTLIEKEMLKLGPVFLDSYIRQFLYETILVGLVTGIVSGTGKESPIGLDRDIHKGVAVSDGAYPQKQAIAVNSFAPLEYGTLLAKLAVTEVYYTSDTDGSIVAASTAANADGSAKAGYTKHGGRTRNFTEVTMLCNMVDYLTKIMPATTVLNTAATYTNNVFPFPTEVIPVSGVEQGKAIVCLPEEYFMGIGTPKEGVITFSDDAFFLEDQRAFLAKLTGNGRPFDNTVSILIDISNLDPAYITVLNKTETLTA